MNLSKNFRYLRLVGPVEQTFVVKLNEARDNLKLTGLENKLVVKEFLFYF